MSLHLYCATATKIKIIKTVTQYLKSIIMELTLKSILTGRGTEFFVLDEKAFYSHQMEQSEIRLAPKSLKQKLIDFIDRNSEAKAAYTEMVGPDQDSLIEQCVKCMFANLDGTPDLDEKGVLTPEFVMCPLRGSCPHEGIGCLSKLTVGKGEFTSSEIRVFVNTRYTNEQIANKLFVTVETVKKHMQNMLVKSGLQNRADLAVYATILNLIQ